MLADIDASLNELAYVTARVSRNFSCGNASCVCIVYWIFDSFLC